jgi:tyrosyl-tRNA synthetase
MDKIDEVLTRGVEKIYPSKEALEKVLRSGKKIKLYQGFDPSMPNLHLGHMVGVLKLKQFQDLGHEVIFLIGDFTGLIGDPTDKSATRKLLTRKQVLENSKTWKEQAGRVLSFKGKNPVKILYNSQWLSKLSFADLLDLSHRLTYQQIIKRELFRKREKEGKDIYLHEFLYPLMQGYDGVAMDVDLEIGGSDQMFNMLVGRDLMKKLKKKEKFVLTTKLLVDAKGEKVGKTAGNALFLNASANDMYGGIMSFPDEVIIPSFELLTRVSIEQVKKDKEALKKGRINPMELKKKLASEIVKLLYGAREAKIAEEDFKKQFKEKRKPSKVPDTPGAIEPGKHSIAKALPTLIPSFAGTATISEAKRLIKQGGLEFEGQKIDDPNMEIDFKGGEIIKAGKRRIYKVKIE